uniref:Uncharacterized protein n=1 Tax=Heterorhabditis bacteriophora TaxID=37862 RepID=A0A1I7WCJ8_HETBA
MLVLILLFSSAYAIKCISLSIGLFVLVL